MISWTSALGTLFCGDFGRCTSRVRSHARGCPKSPHKSVPSTDVQDIIYELKVCTRRHKKPKQPNKDELRGWVHAFEVLKRKSRIKAE